MRPMRTLCLIATLLFAVGCASNNEGKIEGTKWTSDPATIKGQYLSPGALELDFRADGGLVYRARSQTFTGRYSLGGGDTIHFHLEQYLAGSKSHAERITVRGEAMTMIDADGTEMTFRRQK